MWAKTKPRPLTPPPAMTPYGDSWEEQAFAEDAAGTLGGCVWPPRSYSCTFCRREFKSAQALGGHMNVHRRDRARLKQSSGDVAGVVPKAHALAACTSLDAVPYSTTFLYSNPNPKPNPNSNPPVSSSHPPPPSWSSFLSEKRDHDYGRKRSRSRVEKEDCVTELHVSKSLSLVACNNRTQTSDDYEEVASCKRRRMTDSPLPEMTEVERCVDGESEVVIKLCPVEELDLELRLGNNPKVK